MREVSSRIIARADALYRARSDLRGALELYEEAIRGGADALGLAQRRWICAMLLGDFETAWRVSDEVLAERHRRGLSCAGQPHHLRWVWDGTPLDGRNVLVRCYHGLGDVIQFIRLVPLLRRRAAKVTVEAVAQLLPLLRGFPGIDALVPLDEAMLSHDVGIELLELPHALRLTLEDVPRRVPYLHARRAARGAGGKLKVGLAWAAGAWRPERSVPLPLLEPLADMPNVRLFNLQRGEALDELDRSFPGMLIETGRSMELLDTAATISALDLVITVDTMVAHLAGALGVPTWTMLHFSADWRWMTQREDSPWYPTMRLFRQDETADWRKVVGAVERELRALATEERHRHGM